MSCSCGHYLAECAYCDRGKRQPTRLEEIAKARGVDPWLFRMELQDRIAEERRKCALAKAPVQQGGAVPIPEQAFDATGGDPLAALDLVLKLRGELDERKAA